LSISSKMLSSISSVILKLIVTVSPLIDKYLFSCGLLLFRQGAD
jgi:hypothetical protein